MFLLDVDVHVGENANGHVCDCVRARARACVAKTTRSVTSPIIIHQQSAVTEIAMIPETELCIVFSWWEEDGILVRARDSSRVARAPTAVDRLAAFSALLWCSDAAEREGDFLQGS